MCIVVVMTLLRVCVCVLYMGALCVRLLCVRVFFLLRCVVFFLFCPYALCAYDVFVLFVCGFCGVCMLFLFIYFLFFFSFTFLSVCVVCFFCVFFVVVGFAFYLCACVLFVALALFLF